MKLLNGFLIVMLLLVNNHLFSQSYLVEDNGYYRYFIGDKEPNVDWKNRDFIDTSWIQGDSTIGYGHSNIITHIPLTSSVYLRIKIDLTDSMIHLIKDANLRVDFDDAFVAYLNGTEIARVNLGKRGDPVPFNRLSDRSHEALGYRSHYYNQLDGYYIDKDTLSKILKSGTNLLAIQVQNDSLSGSDLSFRCTLVNLTNVYYSLWGADTRYIRQVPLDSTYFPIVKVNTDALGIPDYHVKYVAQMGIINNKNGKINHATDSLNDYNGRIRIEWRGESSKDFPKRSFNLETEDSTGANLNVPLLGMPAENDWILCGPFADKSQIRNELENQIGRKLGHYEPRTRYCELLLNDEFLGLYELTEKIKRDSNRVNIAKLDSTDTSGINITGGYIVKYDKPTGALEWVYPKSDDITQVQEYYLSNFLAEFYAVLDAPGFRDPLLGYKKYIDPQSLIDYIIANEVSKNCDAYLYSTYLYKDKDSRDGRLKYGPLWDYDIAFGTAVYQDGFRTDGWQFDINEGLMIHKIVNDSAFSIQLAQKWVQLRKGFLSTSSIMNMIDSLTNYIHDARVRNYLVWPVIDKHLFGDIYVTSSYSEEISRMKDWLNTRLLWIDGNISSLVTGVPSLLSNKNKNFNIYPNPFSNQFSLEMNVTNSGTYDIDLTDISGKSVSILRNLKLQQGYYGLTFGHDNLSKLFSGLYILTIRQNGSIIHREKMVKY